jgi:Domain of unknown function (DUF5655)
VSSLWRCPRCGRRFANRKQTHTCAAPGRLADHYAGRDPEVVAAFRKLVATVRQNGRVTVLPERTRIAFHARMSFAAFTLKKHWIDGHVVLARRRESPRFRSVQFFSPGNVLHTFRLTGPEAVDDEAADWLREAFLRQMEA